jgi:TRAP transporter TAXI family solute receptor
VIASLRRFLDNPRALAALAGAAVLLAVVLLWAARREQRIEVRLAAGDAHGRRAEIARALVAEAFRHGLDIRLVDTHGSEDSLARVERREIDMALVQGGLDGNEDVREIAPLVLEPLHVLVRESEDLYDLEDLRGRRLMLAPPGSGTRTLSLELLSLAGMEPERDFTEVALSYAELEDADEAALPDAIFHISALPSPVAEDLLASGRYHLMPIPFAASMSVRNVFVAAGSIPAYAYGANPPTPRQDVPTLATRMIAIANRDTSPVAVRRLLESLESEHFLRQANLPRPPLELFAQPEFPLHPGTVAWQHRDDPLLTSEDVQGIESLRSFMVSLIVASVLVWRWLRARRLHGLDRYLAEVARIDREALSIEEAPRLDLPKMLGLRSALGKVKNDALSAYQKGEIASDELLSSFLVHCADVRQHLDRLIVSEREHLQKTARAAGAGEAEAMRTLWRDALADEHADREEVGPRVSAAPAPPAVQDADDDDDPGERET